MFFDTFASEIDRWHTNCVDVKLSLIKQANFYERFSKILMRHGDGACANSSSRGRFYSANFKGLLCQM
jgi:hypothetical protein